MIKILQWKELYTPNGLRPVLFFDPTLSFMTYTNSYGYRNVPIKIEGSHFYDGIYFTDIEVTAQIPCEKQYFSTVLNRDFTIIPPNNGFVSLKKPDHDKSTDFDLESLIVENQLLQSQNESLHNDLLNITSSHNELLSNNNESLSNNDSDYKLSKYYASNEQVKKIDQLSTSKPPKNCIAKGSLELWQIFIILIAIIIIMICCFYSFLFNTK